jgi:hypothetical protein
MDGKEKDESEKFEDKDKNTIHDQQKVLKEEEIRFYQLG